MLQTQAGFDIASLVMESLMLALMVDISAWVMCVYITVRLKNYNKTQ